MSLANPSEIKVEYKLTKALSLDFDNVVVDVDISNIQYKQIKKHTVNFSDGNPKLVKLQNYAVNNITLANGIIQNGIPMNTVTLQLPLSAEGKSRCFNMRFYKPTDCNYQFVDCDGISKVNIQSNVDLSYRFDDHIKHPNSISTYVFECYELEQNPTTLYVGMQNQLSSIDAGVDPIRRRIVPNS